MNYLGHFALNHDLHALPETPCFVMGVALPDLWPRFSRRRRLRWPAVRAAAPPPGDCADLRAGLLNHVAADNWFHSSGAFIDWQGHARRAMLRHAANPAPAGGNGAPGPDRSAAVIDFVAHVAVELALDHHLVRATPELAERFYQALSACDARQVEQNAARLGNVDATGLAGEIEAFVARRFAPRYRDPDTLVRVLEYIISLTRAPAPPAAELAAALDAAIDVVHPPVLWAAAQPLPAVQR